MRVLLLFCCVWLGMAPLCSDAKVVDSFQECSEFFYKGKEPSGMDQNALKICQQYEYGGNFFASLYSTYHRHPLYSAYTFDDCRYAEARSNTWFIEPQVSGSRGDKMSKETDYDIEVLKKKQAINSDYIDTGYDRGHLNPNSFQCDDGRKATFTLTNAVPMDACLNRVHWKEWEAKLRAIIVSEMRDQEATAYLVTGAVPDSNNRIPKRDQDGDKDPQDYNRVTVPTHVWTALCFHHHTDERRSFSMAYIGMNQPVSDIRVMSVQNLNDLLTGLYYSTSVQIFTDDCFPNNKKSETVVNTLYNTVQVPENLRHKRPAETRNAFLSVANQISEGSVPKKIVKVDQFRAEVVFRTISDWFTQTENMKYVERTACVLIKAGMTLHSHDELRKRSLDQEPFVCRLVQEKSDGFKFAADGLTCLIGSQYTVSCTCSTSEGVRPYCSSPCVYRPDRRSHWCYSCEQEIICSPQYSAITYKGEKCRDDHQCGTYEYDYYWCYKESGSWDYCSPPLPSTKTQKGETCRPNCNCAEYGETFSWCYTDFNNNWGYC